jgi:hypothetical protein
MRGGATKQIVRPRWAVFWALVLSVSPLAGQTLTAAQTVNLALSPAGAIVTLPSSLTLVASGSSYTGSLTITSEIRTSATGTGQLGLKVTTDFAPSTGPSTSHGDLSYQCTTASYGTACTGTIQASVSAQTGVTSFAALSCTGGGTPCSSSDPNTTTIQFTVTNSPVFKTGSYMATLTLTISAT